MSGDSFGRLFRITNWGESHGKAIGVVIEGCPPRIPIDPLEIQKDLDRRAPGQSSLTTTRKETDLLEILSGIYQGKTTGTPISMLIFNTDTRKSDYKNIAQVYRPSHADFTYSQKYGIRDPNGGGRSSARMMAGNVAAGAVAKIILRHRLNLSITAYVKAIKNISANIDPNHIPTEIIEENPVRCPDPVAAAKMIALIEKTRDNGDSVGGIIECIIDNVPVGLGEPVFDKLEADLAKAMMSINATRGFEIGSGFHATTMNGSEHNDPFFLDNKVIRTKTNHSGGIQGGISNGMPIVFRVAFKPTASIAHSQQTVDGEGNQLALNISGRHDPCVLPRAVPIVEAMAALVLCDHYLRHTAQCG